jgi:hypothetical protein
MRNPVLIGATVMGAVLLRPCQFPSNGPQRAICPCPRTRRTLWSEGQQRPEAWLAFIEGIHGGRSDAARLA